MSTWDKMNSVRKAKFKLFHIHLCLLLLRLIKLAFFRSKTCLALHFSCWGFGQQHHVDSKIISISRTKYYLGNRGNIANLFCCQSDWSSVEFKLGSQYTAIALASFANVFNKTSRSNKNYSEKFKKKKQLTYHCFRWTSIQILTF